MRHAFITVPALIMAGLVLFFASITQAGGKASIRFDKLEHDFGDVAEMTQLSHTFVFRNTGDDVLVIEKLRAG